MEIRLTFEPPLIPLRQRSFRLSRGSSSGTGFFGEEDREKEADHLPARRSALRSIQEPVERLSLVSKVFRKSKRDHPDQQSCNGQLDAYPRVRRAVQYELVASAEYSRYDEIYIRAVSG